MPKEVRLNDRIWFGKYKNQRFKHILESNLKYVESLMDENKIKLDSKSYSYYEMIKEDMEKENDREESYDYDDYDDNN